MGNAVEVSNLVKRYDGLAAVDGVSFSIREGEVFSFLGPNGAGKTTTTEILEGLRNRTSGDARVFGLDPWTQGDELHRKIGVIPQDFRFYEKITPAEAIEYYAALFGTKADAHQLLERVILADKADAHFDTLSGGQKQKLGLALSLANDPRMCFLDEPTTGLDPQARRSIWEVIRQLKADGRGVFLTTHYLEEAELLADRVAIINHGRIIAEGTPKEIIAKFGAAEKIRVHAPASLANALRAKISQRVVDSEGWVEIEITDQKEILKVLTAMDQTGIPWDSFSTVQENLEDVFVKLVGKMDDGRLKSESPEAPA